MNWQRIHETWSGLHCKVTGHWQNAISADLSQSWVCDALSREEQARYGISREEAHRCVGEWINDPGVLDDWNDTRSILDM
jgi:hypothetical protein